MLKASPQTTLFQASNPQTGAEVVIKLLSPPGAIAPEASQERFANAMKALQAANLESFPRLVDFGFQPDSSAFMVLETVPGHGLDTLAGAKPARILPLLLKTVVALERLAELGTAHHNLSPDNILVTPDGAVRIVGFGTAAFLAEADGSGLLGHSPESDRYAAPELLDPSAQRPAEGWVSDIYTLSLIICERSSTHRRPTSAPTTLTSPSPSASVSSSVTSTARADPGRRAVHGLVRARSHVRRPARDAPQRPPRNHG